MKPQTNFFGETYEVPAGHSYPTNEDLAEAKSQLRRWSEEWREKKTAEMDYFCGRREQQINESETASTMSASRISHKQEKAQQIAKAAQEQFGSSHRKTGDGRKVQFDHPESPTAPRDQMREQGSDQKGGTSDIDKYLK